MAAKKKTKRKLRGGPTRSDLRSAMAEKGEPNPRVGVKPTPFRMRRSFRGIDGRSVEVIWDWCVTGYFSQRELAERFGLSAGVVGAICRCMPESWGR